MAQVPKDYFEAVKFVALARQGWPVPELRKHIKREAKKLSKNSSHLLQVKYYHEENMPILVSAANRDEDFLCTLLLNYLLMDPNTQSSQTGRTALHQAAYKGGEELKAMQVLLDNNSINLEVRDACQATPLLLAAATCNHKAIEKLTERHCSLEADGFLGRPLHLSCYQDDRRSVSKLIGAGADVDHVLYDIVTPLAAAIYGGSLDCVKELLEVGRANVNAIPVLCKAVSAGSVEIVRYLLEHNADPNIYQEELNEDLPIIRAARMGRRDLVKLLFPVTASFLEANWTIQGIFDYIRCDSFRTQEQQRVEKVERMLGRIIEEVKTRHYLAAKLLYEAVMSDLEDDTRELYLAFCDFQILRAVLSYCDRIDSDWFAKLGRHYSSQQSYGYAAGAYRSAIVLNPHRNTLRDELKTVLEKQNLPSTRA